MILPISGSFPVRGSVPLFSNGKALEKRRVESGINTRAEARSVTKASSTPYLLNSTTLYHPLLLCSIVPPFVIECILRPLAVDYF